MRRLLSFICLIGLATPALSHVPPGEHGSFVAGFSHPFFRLDHILAMVTVGLWASLLRRPGLWVMPSSFVVTMIFGFGLALLHVPIPMVESVILASTIVLGLTVALALRFDYRVCALLVGLVALFHGYAHGSELGEAGALGFGAGFVLATTLLHCAGLGLGLVSRRFGQGFGNRSGLMPRALGAAAALIGMGIVIG